MRAPNYWKAIIRRDLFHEKRSISERELFEFIDRTETNGTHEDTEEVVNAIFIHAAKTGNMEAMKLLINHGYVPDLNIRDETGRTALDYAQYRRDYDTVHYLINQGVEF